MHIRHRKRYALLLATLLSLPFLAHAESLKKAKHGDIQMLLDAAKGADTAYWATYIGETKNRVYIEVANIANASSSLSGKPQYEVYWLPRSEITPKQLMLFKKYKANGSQPPTKLMQLINQTYSAARPEILKLGWLPAKKNGNVMWATSIQKVYPEVDGCAADRPLCSFSFRKANDKCLRIITEGSELDKLKVVNVLHDCDRP